MYQVSKLKVKSYWLILIWQALRIRFLLPLMMVVQILTALGVVFGFALLLPSMDGHTARYLSTGAPTIILLTLGLVLAPNMVSQSKLEGSFDYIRSWPAPRMAYLAADATLWFIVALPGLAVAMVASEWQFGLSFQPTLFLLPSLVLVFLTALGIGFSVAYLLPPMATNFVTQVMVFFVLLFSPINFPVDRLPVWLATLHGILPIQYMAEIIRGTLDPNHFEASTAAYGVLLFWLILGFICTYLVISLRR